MIHVHISGHYPIFENPSTCPKRARAERICDATRARRKGQIDGEFIGTPGRSIRSAYAAYIKRFK